MPSGELLFSGCFVRQSAQKAHSALATTVMMCLLGALALTTFIIPAPLQPASLKVTSLDVCVLAATSQQ